MISLNANNVMFNKKIYHLIYITMITNDIAQANCHIRILYIIPQDLKSWVISMYVTYKKNFHL